MGKKQHSKDRMYLTATEWKALGGFKEKTTPQAKSLPFDRCALSFLPYETPVCDEDGNIFDVVHIIPYLKKHRTNPVTGKPQKYKDLIKLKMHKNAKGLWCCPITYKVFNAHSHIVAVKVSGNVYDYEAVKELNLKPKNWLDLVTNEPFTRADIITIQDPHNSDNKDVAAFHHVTSGSGAAAQEASQTNVNDAMKRVLATLPSEEKDGSNDGNSAAKGKPKAVSSVTLSSASSSSAPRSRQTSHHYTASFTSTAMAPRTHSERLLLTEEQKRQQWYDHIRTKGDKAKALVRITTSLGNINCLLHCNLVPATCHNFLTLAKQGYYDKTIFHRLIPSFMIQGGDPTGSGKGGKCAWSDQEAIKDEFTPRLRHDNRGIISMANSGPNTGKSQFFITFAPCQHLDDKHSIFGQVVGGMDVLAKLEQAPVHAKNDRPKGGLSIVSVTVYQNPFDEPFEAKDELELDRIRQEDISRRRDFARGRITAAEYAAGEAAAAARAKGDSSGGVDANDAAKRKWFSAPQPEQKVFKEDSNAVGKYIDPSQYGSAAGVKRPGEKRALAMPAPAAVASSIKKRKAAGYGDFSGF